MYTLLIIMFVFVAFLQTVVILLQSSKGGGLAGAFGGSSMNTAFGSRGTATFLSKLTSGLAISFMVIALILGLMKSSSTSSSSLISRTAQESQQPAAQSAPASLGIQDITPTQPQTGSEAAPSGSEQAPPPEQNPPENQ